MSDADGKQRRYRDAVAGPPGDFVFDEAVAEVPNYALRFVPPPDRPRLLARIRRGLRPDGILILSEKIAVEDEQADALMVEMHHALQRAHGYSELDISRKRSALERVLQPDTLSLHRARLARAGFARADLWLRCFKFVSLVAQR